MIVFAMGIVAGQFIQKYNVVPDVASKLRSGFTATTADGTEFKLEVRRLLVSQFEDTYDTEGDSRRLKELVELRTGRTALLLIDVWAGHPNDGWKERTNQLIDSKIAPLIKTARDNGILVIHAPHDSEIADAATPVAGEIVMKETLYPEETLELDRYLKERGITTVIFAGFASNLCLLNRPVGLINVRRLGYETILLRDCTIAYETAETLEEEWTNKVIIDLVEIQWGMTSTLSDLTNALL
ncbi:MAG: isochorismatase family protein [Candidatus Lindowbacteria bacterium]|nr:isochorismatase family protein [Candidatus Lindowbacteria bacterium]